MKKLPLLIRPFSKLVVGLCLLLFILPDIVSGQTLSTWKSGTSKTIITPEKAMWMAGYGHRNQPAQGKYSDLWLKVLALEDRNGNQVLLITSDILGFPKKLSDNIRAQIYRKFGLTKAQVILNSSHTHSGPVLEDALYDIYPLDEEQRTTISTYSQNLTETVIQLAGQALEDMSPSTIYHGTGVARFQVNRRNNNEKEVGNLTELKGPNDHAVPVIKVVNEKNEITAVVFGYACHPTVLDHYYWSADYPGYAQEALEEKYQGAVAFFFQGAGGDQNPLPRRSLPLANQYGKTLAAAVERILEEEMTQLEPNLAFDYREIYLELNGPPAKSALEKMIKEQTGYMKRWAERILASTENGDVLPNQYPYPLQIWKIGDQPIFNMGGEVTVGYANRLKEKYGPNIFVMAYSNDVMGYIPTELILEEGGYEGNSSQMVYGLPNTWKKGLENQILETFDQMAAKLSIDIVK